MNKGLLFVLTGASSVGKKDIRDRLLGDEQLHLNYSISMTTRPKRGEEVDVGIIILSIMKPLRRLCEIVSCWSIQSLTAITMEHQSIRWIFC